VLLVGVILIIGFLSRLTSGPQQIAPDTMVFAVSGQPALVFAHSIGNVQIRPGSDGQVTVQAERHGLSDQIQLHYHQQGDAIHVTSDIDNDPLTATWVDFIVRLPRSAGARVDLQNGGTLDVAGVNGPMDLRNTTGAIWATNDTGSLTTTTDSGSISITSFAGQLTASTQNGTITTTNARLEGRSALQAASGTINFHGSLDRTGEVVFHNTNGLIGITLPERSVFHVDAESSSSSLSTNFPGIRTDHQHGKNEAHGTIGTGPLAQITILSVSGAMQLQAES
jgi:hypothetical protein